MTYKTLEEMRIKLRNKYTIWTLIIIFITIIALIIIKDPTVIIITLAIGFLLMFLFTRKKEKEYSLAFKDFFVKSSLAKIFTNLNYEPEKGIPYNVIDSTKMMRMGDIYSSNDLVTAKYKNIGFTQSDVHIQEEHTYVDSDGDTHTTYITIFKGRWMIFNFNKTFKANVQVCQKGFGNNKVNTLFSKQKYQKVKMESQDFNKHFKVYAEQPIDAFYILTPKVMEKIRNLDERNKGRLLLCFVDNKLHVGIYDNNDSFEHGSVYKKINQEKVINEIATDIQKITMFIDELELDNDLFKKIV